MCLLFMVSAFFYAQCCLLCLFIGIMLHRYWILYAVKFLLGDNFFKSANYTIEALCAAPFSEEKENLRNIESQILTKRAEISKFETEYREVCTLTQALHMVVIAYLFINLTLSLCRFWHNSQRWQADMRMKCKQWVFLFQGFYATSPPPPNPFPLKYSTIPLNFCYLFFRRLMSYWNKEMKYMHHTPLLL